MPSSLKLTGATFPWLAFIFSSLVHAHHGSMANSALYDADELIELEGEITEVLWRNPHARAHLSVVDDNGEETVWEIETQPGPIEFGRMGISEEDLLGHVRVAGYRSKRNPDSIGVLHLLLPSGQGVPPEQQGTAVVKHGRQDRATGTGSCQSRRRERNGERHLSDVEQTARTSPAGRKLRASADRARARALRRIRRAQRQPGTRMPIGRGGDHVRSQSNGGC